MRIRTLLFVASALLGMLVAASAQAQNKSDKCPVTDYGNGVYFFECVGDAFGQKLSSFRATLRGQDIVGLATRVSYPHSMGYYVIVSRK